MGRTKKPAPSDPAPLAVWPGWKLILFGILLPLLGMALITLAVASLALRVGGVWRSSGVFSSVLVVGWMLVLGLGLLGMAWLVVSELRRRRRFPSIDEQQARQATAKESALQALEQSRGAFRMGVWCAALGTPGLSLCVVYQAMGIDPPGWASMLSLPLVVIAPLCWMHAIKTGVVLWLFRRGHAKWLGYAALCLALYFVTIGILVSTSLGR